MGKMLRTISRSGSWRAKPRKGHKPQASTPLLANLIKRLRLATKEGT